MTVTDEAAITDLLYAYNVAADALDIDGWASCFTADGVFNGAMQSFRAQADKDEFGAHARELEASGLPRLRHFLSNIRVSVHQDHAESHCFFLIVATPDDGPSSISMVGEYADRLVKTDGRWLFQERTVTTDGTAYKRRVPSEEGTLIARLGLPGMPSELSSPAGAVRTQPLRADARQNAERVLVGARQAIAQGGLGVSYHDIARSAGVGVGTVYRRFPDRAELLEAVLLDVLGELSDGARNALADPDPWRGFSAFFATLAARFRENAGLSQALDDRGGDRVAAARQQLLREIRGLTARAAAAGALRDDIGWQDVVLLAASLPRSGLCALDLSPTDDQVQRCLGVILDGLAPRRKGQGGIDGEDRSRGR